MTNSITITASTVTTKAQSIVRDIDPTTFHADTLSAIFEYGLRRWFQDSINSQAHVARQAESEFDADAAFNERIAQAVSGEINRRGSGNAVSDETLWNRRAVRELAKANAALRDKLRATESGDERDAFLDHITANNAELVKTVATRLRKEAAAKAKAAESVADELTF